MSNFSKNIAIVIRVLILAIAFLLPFMPKLLGVLIGILVLAVFLEGRIFKNFSGIFRNRVVLFSTLFYLVYLLGILKSDNLKYGWLDIQTKLSILLLPVIFTSISRNKVTDAFRISGTFCIGCICAMIICLVRSAIYFDINGFDGFFYQRLSYFIHPGYFAMYLNFCVCFLIHEIVFGEKNVNVTIRKFLFPATVFLIAGLLLLSSKAGILFLLFTLLATIIFLLVRKKSGKILISLVLLLTGALVFTVSTPEISKRWNEMSHTISGTVGENEGHTTGQRLKTWEGSIKVIMEHPLTGVGTGDVKDVLLKKYDELGMPDMVAMRLNAHNQFLQTTIALGIIGLFILTMLFFTALKQFIRDRNFLAVAFIIIIIFNALIESILEVQAGVIFFAFFLGAFCCGYDMNKEQNTL